MLIWLVCLRLLACVVYTCQFLFFLRFFLNSFQERRAGREHARPNRDILKERIMDKRIIESGDSSGYESSVQTHRSVLRKQETDEEH